jgi:hypothetical protein
MHIEPLARQVQSGVQHVWSLPVLVALTTQLVTGEAPFHDIPSWGVTSDLGFT